MTKVLAWLRKIPVVGWLVLGLVVAGLVAWRAIRSALNAQARLRLAVQMAAARRKFEAVESTVSRRALDERAAARIRYNEETARLEAARARIDASTGSKLADEINRAFGGGKNAP